MAYKKKKFRLAPKGKFSLDAPYKKLGKEGRRKGIRMK